MGNSPDQPPAVLENKTAILCHWLFATLLAAAFAAEIISFFHPVSFGTQLDAVFIILAAISTLAALWRQLPMQNVLLAALGIAVLGAGLMALGAKINLFVFASGIGPVLFKTLTWVTPLMWIIIVLNSRGVGRLILRPWRKNKTYGYRLIGLTALLVLLFDIVFDPFASRIRHCWLWLPTTLKVTWQGAPLINFLAWGFVAALILLFITPALIVKKPRPKKGAVFYPLGVWLGGVSLCATGCAVGGLWVPVYVDAAIGIGVAIFAIRGAMW
jgi:Carotenoid biosynthesis protein